VSATTTIDLNQQDIFVRQGFEKIWVGSLPIEKEIHFNKNGEISPVRSHQRRRFGSLCS
jgi:hypothetical protein